MAAENHLIGRREELRKLAEFGPVLRTGTQALVIEAPEGMGKTALWEEGLRACAGRGLRVLAARPSRSELDMAFTTLCDLLEGPADQLLATLPAPQRHALECVMLRGESIGDQVGLRAASLGALHLLRHLADTAPVLLAIDNLQWVDSASARVLGFVLRRLSTASIGLLATLRAGRHEPVVHAALPPGRVLQMTVNPLTVGQLGELILQRLGTAPPRPVLVRMHRATGGNPRWGLEIAAEVAGRRGRRLPVHYMPVPNHLAERMAPRLASLQPSARIALVIISALAMPSPDVLRAVMRRAGADPDGVTQALRAGTLRLIDEEVACSEPILATAAYASASPAHRTLVHAAIAASVSDPDERAWHEALSRPGADRWLASRLEGACRQARVRGRVEAAAALAEQAMEHTSERYEGDRVRRCLQAADGWFAAGDLSRARDLLTPLVDRLEHGSGRQEALCMLGKLAVQDQTLQAGRDLLLLSLREPAPEPAIAARADLELAWTSLTAGQLTEARRECRRALTLSSRSGPPATEIEAGALLASIAEMSGWGDPAVPCEPWPELDAETSVRPALITAHSLLRRGEVDAARAVLTDCLRRCRARGCQAGVPMLHLGFAELECWAGSLVGALQHAHAGLRAARAAGQRAPQASLLAAGALTNQRSENPTAARAWGVKCVELATRSGDAIAELMGREALARVELATGDPAAAADQFDAVVERWRRLGIGDPWFVRFVPEHVDALVAADRQGDATSLLASWQRTGRRLPRPWLGPLAARAAAALQVARGDLHGAMERLCNAAANAQALPPYELGRTLLMLGTLERRLKRRAAARSSLSRALEAFRLIGADRCMEEAERQLGRLGERSPFTTLTGTEAQIAELVAQGLTNLEVGQRLFVSARTVECNLTSVYRKLAVTRRGHLASLLARADSDGSRRPLRSNA